MVTHWSQEALSRLAPRAIPASGAIPARTHTGTDLGRGVLARLGLPVRLRGSPGQQEHASSDLGP